ncbi:MAG: HAD family hydrolase [Paracoccaceae bacterium]|nr:HAD family hydrolase [Paracoccaceae bacterium]
MRRKMSQPIAAVLFDKDGTLFDFNATWGAWARGILDELSAGDAAGAARMAAAIRFAPETALFAPDSPVIAGTVAEVAALLLPHLPGMTQPQLVARLDAGAQEAPQMPAVPLRPCLEGLRGRGLRLGVATNDAEASARVHLAQAGVAELFEFVVGYDSGHGAKPAPGQLLAFAQAVGVAPGAVAMVGDSLHDLHAARAAGMLAVGVLSGPARAEALAPVADVVLEDIAGLEAWLANGAPCGISV